ncbi:MAG: hypothetical protein PQJ46_09490 [Spirochaetales bacterium]|nr:hypothetical protein [Spirochaetales bacterium]
MKIINFFKNFFSTDNKINENVVFAAILLVWLLIVFTLGLCKVITLIDVTQLGVFVGLFMALCGIGANRANNANKLVNQITEKFEE